MTTQVISLPPAAPFIAQWCERVKSHPFFSEDDKITLDQFVIACQFQTTESMDPSVRIEARMSASWAIGCILDKYEGKHRILKRRLKEESDQKAKSLAFAQTDQGKNLTVKQIEILVNTSEEVGRLSYQVSEMERLVSSLGRIEWRIEKQQEDLKQISTNYRREIR